MVRTCNFCCIFLEEFDPHLTCKKCRQPDKNRFYCSNSECKACIAIQSYKPLDYFLKKKAEAVINAQKPVSVSHPTFSGLTGPNHNNTATSIVNSVNRMTEQVNNKLLNNVSIKEETDIENRLYGRILSTLMRSIKNDERPDISENKFLNSADTPNNDVKTSIVDDSFDLFTKNGSLIKLSSKCGDILSLNTLLSEPSKAENLITSIGIKTKDNIWPVDINPSFILNMCSELEISMKFHPKARQFQTVIFGEFKPTLPNDILSGDFCLTPLSYDLEIQFLQSRQKLQVLLFIYSLEESLLTSKLVSSIKNISDVLINIKDKVESLIISEANSFGLIIQNLRKFMLSGSVCILDGAIEKLIHGSTHPTQFFGSFVFVLQKIIKDLGPEYCIKNKNMPLMTLKKLPVPSDPFNFKCYDKALKEFTNYNRNNDNDKLTLALYLLPTELKSMLQIDGKIQYDYLIGILNTNLCTKEEVIRKKLYRTRVQSATESVTSFAEDLRKLVPKKLSPKTKENMLRDQFICGIYDQQVQEKLCHQFTLTFSECIKFAENCMKPVNIVKEQIEDDQPKVNKSKHRLSSTDENSTCKRVKHNNNYNSSFPNNWMECLSYEKLEAYNIICPWSGIKLRSLTSTVD